MANAQDRQYAAHLRLARAERDRQREMQQNITRREVAGAAEPILVPSLTDSFPVYHALNKALRLMANVVACSGETDPLVACEGCVQEIKDWFRFAGADVEKWSDL